MNRLTGYFRELASRRLTEGVIASGMITRPDGTAYPVAACPGLWVYWLNLSGSRRIGDGWAFPLVAAFHGEGFTPIIHVLSGCPLCLVIEDNPGRKPSPADTAFSHVRELNNARGFPPCEASVIVRQCLNA